MGCGVGKFGGQERTGRRLRVGVGMREEVGSMDLNHFRRGDQ